MKCDLRTFRHKGLLILAGLLVFLLPFSVIGQQVASKVVPAKAFATVVSYDATNTYFSADLSCFSSFFERAWFLELVFADPQMVVNNSKITGESFDVFSSREYDSALMLEKLHAYRVQAIEAGKSTPASQKKELLVKYEKYK